ncbi:MAG: hypothetical protein IAE98_02045 [Candidatus Kapabacteria bacterium]|nr:hypothetical protein [Candidatus Kapabacteria bacterium]MCB0536354.1 hypothetical protein [Bacteroidota bacterium]
MVFKAYWIFDEDLSTLSDINIIASRFSFAPPIHSYKGEIEITINAIRFSGIHINSSENFNFNIFQSEILEIYYGFDELYSVYLVRGLGIWKPLKIKFQNGIYVSSVYIISNYKLGISSNTKLFSCIKQWLENY